MDPAHGCIVAGWTSFLGGAASGIVLGLFFRDERWLGGYGSWRRRLLRLGHIAFFGLGFVNLLFGLSIRAYPVPAAHASLASMALIGSVATMSPVCFLSAWRPALRHLFPVPVAGLVIGIVALLSGWVAA